MEFNCETLISCLKATKLSEVVHAPIIDEQTHQYQVVGMHVNDCLEAIEKEIATLKQYKMHKEEAEYLAKQLTSLLDKKAKLEAEINIKETELKELHDDLPVYLKTRGIMNLTDLKSFFRQYDSDREAEMNRSLDEYYSHKNRII